MCPFDNRHALRCDSACFEITRGSVQALTHLSSHNRLEQSQESRFCGRGKSLVRVRLRSTGLRLGFRVKSDGGGESEGEGVRVRVRVGVLA